MLSKAACLKVNISTSTSLSIETIRRTRAYGSLLRYVLQKELPKRIIAVSDAIVIGDGLVDASDDKIKSFVSVEKLTLRLATCLAKTYTPKSGEAPYCYLECTRPNRAEGDGYIIASVDISLP